MKLIFDIKLWIIIGLILGLVIGFDHPDASTMLMIVLMIQMTLALQGLKFNISDFKDNKKEILICLVFCFVFNTGLTLLTGLLFIDNVALWYGWVMLASVPCAISVMTTTFYLKGNMKMGMLGFTGIYAVAIVLTPLMTHFLMGEAVSSIKILEYVLLFVILPLILDIPLNRVSIPPKLKILVMNAIILMMVFISVGFRRDYILSNPDVAIWIIVANLARIFIPCYVLIFLMKRMHVNRENGIVYASMITWRNSGLASTLCIVMLGATYPDAVLPGVLSLLVENLWFVFMQGSFDKIWPPEKASC